MDTRRVVPKLEFYITNVCNLTCQGCNRFNDLPFRGHHRWNDYKSIIAQWADKIKVEQVVIMGGEPLLNPDINDWIRGLKAAWSVDPQIMSNGTHLDKVPGLYETMLETQAWIGVSIHDGPDREKTYQIIRDFFPDGCQEDSENIHGGERVFRDKNWIKVETWNYTHFKPNALKFTDQGRLTLHNNPPEKAFQICAFQHHKNYHFIRGRIYRCGPVALFPELDDQFNLDLSDEDKALIRSYRSLSIDEYDERSDDFFEHIDDMIPQCKFCSADDQYHELVFHDHKKKRVNIV